MPLYEYHCLTCNHRWSVVERAADHGRELPVCPTCGAKDVEPVLAPFFAKTVRKS